jgi:hypothetical protein
MNECVRSARKFRCDWPSVDAKPSEREIESERQPLVGRIVPRPATKSTSEFGVTDPRTPPCTVVRHRPRRNIRRGGPRRAAKRPRVTKDRVPITKKSSLRVTPLLQSATSPKEASP